MMTRIQSDCHDGGRSKRGRERETALVEIEDQGVEIGAFMSFAVSRREMDSGMSPGVGR